MLKVRNWILNGVLAIAIIAAVHNLPVSNLGHGGQYNRSFSVSDDLEVAIAATHDYHVVIDPGHGGDKNHATSASGHLEKNIVLSLSLQTAVLVRQGAVARGMAVNVVLTRSDDRDVSLASRTKIAKKLKANLIMSVHCNSMADGSRGTVRGTLALVDSRDRNINHDVDKQFADRLSQYVHKAFLEFDKNASRQKTRAEKLAVLNDSSLGNAPGNESTVASLLEVEFIDHAAVDKLLISGPSAAEVQRAVALAIANAILDELAAQQPRSR